MAFMCTLSGPPDDLVVDVGDVHDEENVVVEIVLDHATEDVEWQVSPAKNRSNSGISYYSETRIMEIWLKEISLFMETWKLSFFMLARAVSFFW